MMQLNQRYQESRQLEEQLEFIEQQMSELQMFSKSVEEIGKSSEKEILSSIGKGLFVKCEMKEKEFFVDVGAGVVVKKSPDDAIGIIEQQISRLGEIRYQINDNLNGLSSEFQELIKKLEQVKKE